MQPHPTRRAGVTSPHSRGRRNLTSLEGPARLIHFVSPVDCSLITAACAAQTAACAAHTAACAAQTAAYLIYVLFSLITMNHLLL